MSDAKARLKGIVLQLRRYMEWQGMDDAMDVIPASEEEREEQRERFKARRRARMERLQSSFRSDEGASTSETAEPTPESKSEGGSRFETPSEEESSPSKAPEKRKDGEKNPWTELGEMRRGSSGGGKTEKKQADGGSGSASGGSAGGQQGAPPRHQGPPPGYRPGPSPEQQLAAQQGGGGGAAGSSPAEQKPKTNREKLDWLRDYMGDCQRCPLGKNRTNLVFGEGNPEARLVFVGEAPGAREDKTGRPFVGPAGKLLTKMIGAMGLEREEVYICNVLKSRPPRNRDPRPDEIRECIPFLEKQIQIIDPEVIVTLGRPASQQLLDSDRSLGALRGRWHTYGDAQVMPTYHPAYLLRNENQKRKVWNDLQQVIDKLGLPGPNG